MNSYAKYIKSDIEWLGNIPEHWRKIKIKYVSDICYGLGQPPKLSESGIPIIRATNISQGKITDKDLIFAKIEDLPLERAPLLEEGEILVVRSGAYTGDSAIIPRKFIGAAPGYDLRVQTHAVYPQYLAYCLLSSCVLINQIYLLKLRAAQPHLNAEDLGSCFICMPDNIGEQKAIAYYLDQVTYKIDELIAKKQKLILLLKEKRQALIDEAVTKGLNRETPMKDSGIEWLGDIPSHWDIKPLGYSLSFISYGFTNPMPVADNGPYLLTANDIGDGVINYSTARKTSKKAFVNNLTNKSRPCKDDLLLTKDGTLGRIAIHDGQQACINQSVAILRVNEGKIAPTFLFNILRSYSFQNKMIFDAGGTTIKHIYITRLVKMPIIVPPMKEQLKIVEFINIKISKIDELIHKVQIQIEKLQEYRQSMINEAVTGKIDVRTHREEVMR